MNCWGLILKLFGWKCQITAPHRDKCVICVAPHTSNLDFLIGITAYRSLGRKANFLMKKFWFFFPLKYLLRSLGGIPVDRSDKTKSLTEEVIEQFRTTNYMNLAVTPEGTRSYKQKWHTGFLYIAYGADVPIQLGVIDYKNKLIIIEKEITPTGNTVEDMATIRHFYSNYADAAKYPEKFAP